MLTSQEWLGERCKLRIRDGVLIALPELACRATSVTWATCFPVRVVFGFGFTSRAVVRRAPGVMSEYVLPESLVARSLSDIFTQPSVRLTKLSCIGVPAHETTALLVVIVRSDPSV
jgi:hypothetical protein